MSPSNDAHLWIVGAGIAGMAAAAFALRDAHLRGENVHLIEERGFPGGALDGGAAPGTRGAWVSRGARMFTDETYPCTWDLFETVPSLERPTVSARQEMIDFNEKIRPEAHARLVSGAHRIVDASELGLSSSDRRELFGMILLGERALGSARIDEVFSDRFFATNFWRMWRTTFAFQRWHSAAELRRHFLRFAQELPRLHTLGGARRTRYNQHDSLVLPLQRWLQARGVDIRFGTQVTDVDIVPGKEGRRRVRRLHLQTARGEEIVELRERDRALVTLGSMTGDARYGDNDRPPELVRERTDGAWTLWEKISKKGDDLGRPLAFYGSVDEHKRESFTLTMRDHALLDRISLFSGNQAGTGGLMTFVDSGWQLSLMVPHQPYFRDLPPNTFTLWGFGLQVDDEGDHVRKPMAAATGREVLREIVGQLGFDDALPHFQETIDVTTAMMPYASSVYACRAPGDRPQGIPWGAENFGFLGQFVEIPEDVVLTVEYSVRGAMRAVYGLFDVTREIPRVHHALSSPRVALDALEAAFH